MSADLRILLGVALLATALGAPVRADSRCEAPPPFEILALGGDESGIGGTGLSDPDGIGGTGHADPDSGIGGTGLRGDESGVGGTGIYGTVTAFGSVCVNGLRVHYDDGVEVDLGGARASAADLAVGQVVFLVAHVDDGSLRTERIQVVHAAVGRIASMDTSEGVLRLDGGKPRTVTLHAGTALAEGLERSALAVGDLVRVSGLPDATGRLVASRVERASPAELDFEPPPAPSDLVARSGVERVSIESYLVGGADRVDLAGLRVDLPPRSPARPGQRVRAVGRILPTGVLRVDRPERPVGGASKLRPPERPDRRRDPDRDPRPPRVERPERPERPQRPEVIDRVERPAVKDVVR